MPTTEKAPVKKEIEVCQQPISRQVAVLVMREAGVMNPVHYDGTEFQGPVTREEAVVDARMANLPA